MRCQAAGREDRAEPGAASRPRQSHTTAAHAYAGSLPFALPAKQPPAVKQQHDQQKKQTRNPSASLLQHETAFSFVAPNWQPLVGHSRQHQRVEKDVSRAEQLGNWVNIWHCSA